MGARRGDAPFRSSCSLDDAGARPDRSTTPSPPTLAERRDSRSPRGVSAGRRTVLGVVVGAEPPVMGWRSGAARRDRRMRSRFRRASSSSPPGLRATTRLRSPRACAWCCPRVRRARFRRLPDGGWRLAEPPGPPAQLVASAPVEGGTARQRAIVAELARAGWHAHGRRPLPRCRDDAADAATDGRGRTSLTRGSRARPSGAGRRRRPVGRPRAQRAAVGRRRRDRRGAAGAGRRRCSCTG